MYIVFFFIILLSTFQKYDLTAECKHTNNIFQLIFLKYSIRIFQAHCKGKVEVKSAFFRYPTRPDVPILRDCSITVNPGQTLALVGQSGCGKSTTVQLIERFYDPTEGSVVSSVVCASNKSGKQQ